MTALEIILIIAGVLVVSGLIVFAIVWSIKKKKENEIQFDYVTKHGIKIKLSPLLQDLKAEDIESWTDDLVNFWHEVEGWDKESMYAEIKKTSIILYDELYLERGGIKVSGITWPYSYKIEIATLYKPELDQAVYTPFKKVKSLFRHEESHVIVGKMATDIPYDNEHHHALFAEMGLGA